MQIVLRARKNHLFIVIRRNESPIHSNNMSSSFCFLLLHKYCKWRKFYDSPLRCEQVRFGALNGRKSIRLYWESVKGCVRTGIRINPNYLCCNYVRQRSICEHGTTSTGVPSSVFWRLIFNLNISAEKQLFYYEWNVLWLY